MLSGVDQVTQRSPQVLPGSQAVLFTSNTNAAYFDNAGIVVYSIASGQRKTVQRGGFHARYLLSGHLAYVHEGTLFAVPFDLQRLEVTGQPVPLLEGVAADPIGGGAQFSFSDTEKLLNRVRHTSVSKLDQICLLIDAESAVFGCLTVILRDDRFMPHQFSLPELRRKL